MQYLKVFNEMKPQYIEVVIRNDGMHELEEQLDGLQVYSSDEKRIYSVPLDDSRIAKLKDFGIAGDSSIYVSLAYHQSKSLRDVAVVDEQGESVPSYRADRDSDMRKWVKKKMFITLAKGSRVYVAGWRLAIDSDEFCNNIMLLSYEIGQVNCSLRCFLPSLIKS